MDIFGEFLGIVFLVLFGNGVVVGVVLFKMKNYNFGWIVIIFGWGFVVVIVVLVFGNISFVYLNLVVLLVFVIKGDLVWGIVIFYMIV